MIDRELVEKALSEIDKPTPVLNMPEDSMNGTSSIVTTFEFRVALLGYTSTDKLLILASDILASRYWVFSLALDYDGVLLGELLYSADSFIPANHYFHENAEILPLAEYLGTR